MPSPNLTFQVAEYIHKTDYSDLPEDVIEKAKLCLLDWVGVTLAGAREPISTITHDLVDSLGGDEQSTIIGKGLKTNLLFASLVNGTNAHVLEFDDGLLDGPGHPSAPIIPPILSLAEWKGLPGSDFINAYTIGVQIFFSINAANSPHHSNEGWHSTGTLGHLAASAASGKLLNLNIPQIVNALGISATQAAGIKSAFGTMCKPLNAGKASMDGLLAALLAERNFSSSDDPMGGTDGFLEVFSSGSNPEALKKALTGGYFLNDIRFKLYPSCFNTHAAIDCILSLRNQYEIKPEEISEIACIVYPRCLEVSANPRPKTGLEAKFSVQYCLALALDEGKVALDSFDDSKVRTSSLDDTMKKIRLLSENAFSKTRTSEVVIKFKNGKSIREKVSLSDMHRDRKKEEADVTQKFRNIAYSLLPAERVDEIIESINSLEKVADMSSITRLCRIE